MKKIVVLLSVVFMMSVTIAGCGGNDDTIQTCIISNNSYISQSELESASEADTLTANEAVFASIHFIESPKGMEYTVKWYVDGEEIKSETKAIQSDTQDILIYELEDEWVKVGSLKLEVIYKDTVLLLKEITIQ